MNPKEGRLRVRGAELVYLEQGGGPLLLCLHGFPDHPRSFRHQLEAFSTTGYRVVAPYLRGYTPGSIVPGQSYQPTAVAEDARALMDALGSERAVVYAHGWGSAGAFAPALGHPDRVHTPVPGSVPNRP